MQVTEQVARSFGALRAEEFSPLVKYLTGERNETLELLTKVIDVPQVYRLQGKAAVLGEILQKIGGADALIALIQKR